MRDYIEHERENLGKAIQLLQSVLLNYHINTLSSVIVCTNMKAWIIPDIKRVNFIFISDKFKRSNMSINKIVKWRIMLLIIVGRSIFFLYKFLIFIFLLSDFIIIDIWDKQTSCLGAFLSWHSMSFGWPTSNIWMTDWSRFVITILIYHKENFPIL